MPGCAKKVKNKIILKNTRGEDVRQQDYFYSKEGKETAHSNFNSKNMCGLPVDREELLTVFDKIFKPEDNFLFYKTQDKEVFLIIVPLNELFFILCTFNHNLNN